MTTEDLTIIEQAGRRCSGCRSGRNWRRLEVIRPEGSDPIVSCPACRSRFTATPAPSAASASRRPNDSSAPAQAQRSAAPASVTDPATSAPSAAPADATTPTPASPAPGSAEPRRDRSHRKTSSSAPHPGDRLKRALRELPPGAHSARRIARAAGLNERKVIPRLRALEAAGEVQRVGQLWSTEPPSTDLEAAFDRLEARTSNLRITRPRKRVG